MTNPTLLQQFTHPLLDWFDHHGRQNLPWQQARDAYRVWVSEIMLQQTQVKTVISYFNRFIQRFPTIDSLALAPEDEVLAHWSGLGYYSRARNLHKTAVIIHSEFQSIFPSEMEQLIKFPGIGRSTAAAIISLAFNKPAAILDGNVKRVLSRYFLIAGALKLASVDKKLWQLANECISLHRCCDYTQAIMDLGAMCCTVKNPDCTNCPLQTSCLAKQHNEVTNYPTLSPKRKLPTKHQQFLLLYCEQSKLIYLEKNPPIGLWGGLWCLPSIDMSQCPTSYIMQTYQLQTNNVREIMTIKHSFSHFHLHIKALCLQTNRLSSTVAEQPGQWFAMNQTTSLGLAKPISSIINHFFMYNAMSS